MGDIREWTKIILQICKNCNHLGGAHLDNVFDNPQGRKRASREHPPFVPCRKCKDEGRKEICHNFRPK